MTHLNDGNTTKSAATISDAVKSLHDIRASLAILNGFGEALESSFAELTDHTNEVASELGLQENPDAYGKMKALEAECLFCLSRIRTSTGQLKERLNELDSRK